MSDELLKRADTWLSGAGGGSVTTVLPVGLVRELAARVRELEAKRDAYKWGYEYLQDRMRSIGREGWAEDCDGEIKDRIAALAQGEKPTQCRPRGWRARGGML